MNNTTTNPEQDQELENVKNEVLRKIGRNVVNFQRFEYLLKGMISCSKISGSVSDLGQKVADRKNAIGKKMMGELVKLFGTDICRSPSQGEQENLSNGENNHITELEITTKFSIELDEDSYNEVVGGLSEMVRERNELIHHLFPRWKMESIESGREMEAYLDKQKEKMVPIFSRLQGIASNMYEFQKDFGEFMASDEGQKQVALAMLRQSQLVAWLLDIAEQNAGPDGWVVLGSAAQIVRKNVPGELAGLKKRHGYKKLKDAILATEWFDIAEESTNKGGVRVLYRKKPDLVFEE